MDVSWKSVWKKWSTSTRLKHARLSWCHSGILLATVSLETYDRNWKKIAPLTNKIRHDFATPLKWRRVWSLGVAVRYCEVQRLIVMAPHRFGQQSPICLEHNFSDGTTGAIWQRRSRSWKIIIELTKFCDTVKYIASVILRAPLREVLCKWICSEVHRCQLRCKFPKIWSYSSTKRNLAILQ